MASKGSIDTRTRESLSRVGNAMKSVKPGELVFLRFGSGTDHERAMKLIMEAFSRVDWRQIRLADNHSEFELAWSKASTDEYFLIDALNKGDSRPDFMLWDRVFDKENTTAGRGLVCIFADSVMSIAKQAPVTWKNKRDYLAWHQEKTGPDTSEGPKVTSSSVETGYYLVNVAKETLQTGDPENARQLLLRATDIFKAQSDLAGLAGAFHLLAEASVARGDTRGALAWVSQAIDYWKLAENDSGYSASVSFMGYLHYQLNQLEMALKSFVSAVEIDEEAEDWDKLSANYRKMAMVYEKLEDFSRAKGLLTKSLELEEECGSEPGIARAHHGLARIEEQQGNYQSAIARFHKALSIRTTSGDKRGLATTLHHLGNLYANLGESEQAEKYYLEAISEEEKLSDADGVARTRAQLGLLRMKEEKFEEALEDLFVAHDVLKKVSTGLANEILDKIERIQDALPADVFASIVRKLSVRDG